MVRCCQCSHRLGRRHRRICVQWSAASAKPRISPALAAQRFSKLPRKRNRSLRSFAEVLFQRSSRQRSSRPYSRRLAVTMQRLVVCTLMPAPTLSHQQDPTPSRGDYLFARSPVLAPQIAAPVRRVTQSTPSRANSQPLPGRTSRGHPAVLIPTEDSPTSLPHRVVTLTNCARADRLSLSPH